MPIWSARALEAMGCTQEEADAKAAKDDEPKSPPAPPVHDDPAAK